LTLRRLKYARGGLAPPSKEQLWNFQREKITLGSASLFLGITQLEFQALLAEKNLCIHYDVDELHEDVKTLQELGLL
jgi:hypothetical protein